MSEIANQIASVHTEIIFGMMNQALVRSHLSTPLLSEEEMNT